MIQSHHHMSTNPPSMGSWERASHRILHAFRLGRIRTRVLVFSLIATLVPALTMSWGSYVINRQFVNEKTEEELQNATVHAAREVNLWLRERFYETRVFSSSYEVTENLEHLLRSSRDDGPAKEARRRLKAYLGSVKGKFPDYDEITVSGLDDSERFPGAHRAVAARLPQDWMKRIRDDANVVGGAYWDERQGRPVITIAVPIRAATGRLLGVMAGTLNFKAVDKILTSYAVGKTGHIHLVDQDGVLIVSSASAVASGLKTRLPGEIKQALATEEGATLSYVSPREGQMVASVRRVAPIGWGVVAEIGYDEAYGRVVRMRNLTLLTLAGVVLGIGLVGYLLALTIVRPLSRLTAGATGVSGGDLQVDLPVVDYGEVGYLTQAFNHMVARLREGRDELAAVTVALGEMNRELKRLSVTDSMTGLYNHGHLLDTLQLEVERARRLKHFFSIMMIDVDNFKQYNDSLGHPAGDKLLSEIGQLIKASIRSIDYAARYGGDEFLVLLHEVGSEGARRLAERIRSSLAAKSWNQGPDKVTLSLGVASFPEHGDDPDTLIASADAALYEAKRRGRNQTTSAPGAGKSRGRG
jgi:diguanylate cyclase (GGDEF)-like protein